LTSSNQSTQPNKTLSLTVTDNWTESWTLEPVNDPDALRRLSALYRFILGITDITDHPKYKLTDDGKPILDENGQRIVDEDFLKKARAQFMCEYPIAQPPQNNSGSAGSPATTTTTTKTNPDTGELETVTKTGGEPKESDTVTLVFKCRTPSGDFKIKTAKVQRSQLRLPECVICIDEDVDEVKLGLRNTAQKFTSATDILQSALTLFERPPPADDIARAAEKKAKIKADDALQGAKADQVLIADAGAFNHDYFFSDNAASIDSQTHTPIPYLNPALIFGLVITQDPAACNPHAVCELGSAAHRYFYGNSTLIEDPRRAFHDFELLVSSAAVAAPAVGGAAIAVQTSPTEIRIRGSP
jgi:hypothetical protein